MKIGIIMRPIYKSSKIMKLATKQSSCVFECVSQSHELAVNIGPHFI